MPQYIVFNIHVNVVFNLLFTLLSKFPRSDGSRNELLLRGWKVGSIFILKVSPLRGWNFFFGGRRVVHFLKFSNVFNVDTCNVSTLLRELDPLEPCRSDHISIMKIIIPLPSHLLLLWMHSLHVIIFVHDIILYRLSVKPFAWSTFNISYVECVSYELPILFPRVQNSFVSNIPLTCFYKRSITISN